MAKDCDVLVIGAGVAGLSAAARLAASGYVVSILEARQRVGGRIHTLYDPTTGAPIELGAEFIHGKPPEILNALRDANIGTTEVDGDSWCSSQRQLSVCNFFGLVDEVLQKMDDSRPDESFSDFLTKCCPDNSAKSEEAKRRSLAYISGFNAADPALVGIHWLVEEMRAEERMKEKSISPPGRICESDPTPGKKRQARSCDDSDRRSRRHDQLGTRFGRNTRQGRRESLLFRCIRVLVTVSLAVLQAPPGEEGSITFAPALPSEKLDAMRKLEMGKVIRVVFRFRSRFWAKITPAKNAKTLSGMSFLFSEDPLFPTWWTTMPTKLPLITAWAPFRAAEALSGKPELFVVEEGLRVLAKLLGVSRSEVDSEFEAGYFHDWQNDPYSRGAYSYGKVGSRGAQQSLGTPIANTLFFAGEATDISGNNGTVHGAIASANRAVSEILESLR